jgi:hypothetical protein
MYADSCKWVRAGHWPCAMRLIPCAACRHRIGQMTAPLYFARSAYGLLLGDLFVLGVLGL